MDHQAGARPTAGAARRFWTVFETIHAVTYFHPTCFGALEAAGAKGFWMGYFAARFAPMGAVGPEMATAICGSFSPARPARALPDAWDHVGPDRALAVRSVAAAQALREIVPDVDAVAAACGDDLDRLVSTLPAVGRPLGSANAAVPEPADPVERLWQHTTTLREHRGDAHVALLVAAGLEGCRANVVATALHGWDPEMLRVSRAWSQEEWAAAVADLRRRGLLDPHEHGLAMTASGIELNTWVEDRTDALAADSYLMAGGDMDAIVASLEPVATAVSSADVIRYPNPIGLPPA